MMGRRTSYKRNILLLTNQEYQEISIEFIAENLEEAVDWILDM